MVKQKGFRDKLGKKEIMDKMGDDDWKRIKLEQEIHSGDIKDDDAVKCAVRCDQLYQNYDKCLGQITGVLHNILSLKGYINDSMVELKSGTIERCYPGTTKLMSKRDMELDIMMMVQRVDDAIRQMWVLLLNLWRYVSIQRIDKKIFFTKEKYVEKVKYVKDELSKVNINLYQER